MTDLQDQSAPIKVDPRFECASQHASAISDAAMALSTAIYLASKDGYRPSISLRHVVSTGNNMFVGDGMGCVSISATIAFDIGKRVAL